MYIKYNLYVCIIINHKYLIMYKATIVKVLENLDEKFNYLKFQEELMKLSLSELNLELELESENSDTDEGLATRTKEIVIDLGEDNYIEIDIKGHYKTEVEEQTYDYPGSYEENFESVEILEVRNSSVLLLEEVNNILEKKGDWVQSFDKFIKKLAK